MFKESSKKCKLYYIIYVIFAVIVCFHHCSIFFHYRIKGYSFVVP